MDVYFRSAKLHKICNSDTEIRRTFGDPCARRLQQRLMELRAADNLGQISRLRPARCHELAGDRAGQLSVDLEHPLRLLFIPANDPVPLKEDGGLDWSQVTQVEILEIVDTH